MNQTLAETSMLHGVLAAAAYAVLGIILLVLTFVVLDRLTPGKLGDIVCDTEDHPGSWMIASSLLAAGIIVATCIS